MTSICRTIAMFVSLYSFTFAQEDEKPKKPEAAKAPTEAEMAKWAKMAAPGDHHKRLQMLVGKWDLEMTTPGGSPSKGTAEYKDILGGRFVTEHVKCELDGMPFEWHGIYGYDIVRKKYTAVWVDNMGTGTDFAEGNNEGDVIQLRGELEEMPGQKVKYKWIMRLRDANNASAEMLETGADGKDTQTLSITMKRAK